MSSYYPTTPQSNEDPRVSQGRFLANFGKLNSDFSQNHQALTVSLNPGFHTKVQFPTGLGADPDLTSPLSSLYPKLLSGLAELFFQNDIGAANVFQITGNPVSTVGTNHSILTPWKIRIQMGTTSTLTQTFSTAFDLGFITLTALATAENTAGTSPRITTVTATDFTWSASGGAPTIRYLILGLNP
jgi:hypothetical protein